MLTWTFIQHWVVWCRSLVMFCLPLFFQVRLENSSIQISVATANDGGNHAICFYCFNDLFWLVIINQAQDSILKLYLKALKEEVPNELRVWEQQLEIRWCSLSIIAGTHTDDVVYSMIGHWKVEHSWTLLQLLSYRVNGFVYFTCVNAIQYMYSVLYHPMIVCFICHPCLIILVFCNICMHLHARGETRRQSRRIVSSSSDVTTC